METINEKGLQKIKGGKGSGCMCSSGWNGARLKGSCQCDGGSTNENANHNIAVKPPVV